MPAVSVFCNRSAMLERRDNYGDLYRDFRWEIPDRFNIGVAVCRPLGAERAATASRFSNTASMASRGG